MAAKIYGLVLAGGRSTRMGRDKGKIDYHGKPQREYLYELLGEICDAVYMSVRAEQEEEISARYQTIVDKDRYPGPFNGLQSAHENFSEVAWLVLATDLPFISAGDLKQLLNARNPKKKATAFASRKRGLPEPLCCIWEPESLREAQQYLEEGKGSSPRNFLKKKSPKIIFPENDKVLMNANNPEDYHLVQKQLRQHEF